MRENLLDPRSKIVPIYSKASKYAAPITADFADTRFLIGSKKTRKTLKNRALRGTASKFDVGFSTSADSTELNINLSENLFYKFTITRF